MVEFRQFRPKKPSGGTTPLVYTNSSWLNYWSYLHGTFTSWKRKGSLSLFTPHCSREYFSLCLEIWVEKTLYFCARNVFAFFSLYSKLSRVKWWKQIIIFISSERYESPDSNAVSLQIFEPAIEERMKKNKSFPGHFCIKIKTNSHKFVSS